MLSMTSRTLVSAPTAGVFSASAAAPASRAAAARIVHVPVGTAALRGIASVAGAAAKRQVSFGVATPLMYSARTANSQFRRFMETHASATEGETAEGETAEGETPAASDVKLYVGNLSWGIDNMDFKDIFVDFDTRDEVVVFDNESGRSRGFGFVTVPDQAEADRIIEALNGVDVDGRPLKVNVSLPKDPNKARPARNDNRFEFDGRKIYFGNLSWGMDHLDLQDLCSEFGQVEDARLITDRETGRSKGFGFVTMSSVSEAEEVVNQLNGQDVDGRVLRVNIAQPRGGN